MVSICLKFRKKATFFLERRHPTGRIRLTVPARWVSGRNPPLLSSGYFNKLKLEIVSPGSPEIRELDAP
jgi:hypothetical protein